MPPEDLVIVFPDVLMRLAEMHDNFLGRLKRVDASFNQIVAKFVPRLKVRTSSSPFDSQVIIFFQHLDLC